ncbi:MAG TPA: carboxypeptidase-like regulatory domain-containing protein [Flavisolibacter sp.]
MRKLLIFITLAVVYSCDCIQRAEGIVLEAESDTPIAGVRISNVDANSQDSANTRTVFSAADGRWRFTRITGGFRRCPGLTLYFSKPGYRTSATSLGAESANDTIYMYREDILVK